MNSQLRKFLVRFYQLPIIGDLICHVGCAFMSLISPPIFWLSRYERIRCGTSIIWTPKNKKQAILDGIECLRNHDAEMFLRLTEKQQLVIYYSQNRTDTNSCGHIFGLHERYIELGTEGVASFIVQALLFSEAAPHINQCKLNNLERAALKIAPRKAIEWMQQHSFDPRLINSYNKVAEKWEQSERFQ